MPYKDPEERKFYRRKWYKNNRQSEKQHVKKRKLRIRRWFEEYKDTLKCNLCSESHPAVIDFHHKKGEEKERGIAQMVGYGYSIKKIKKEISKCQIICSNCHRKIHYKKIQNT